MRNLLIFAILAGFLAGCERAYNAVACDQNGCTTLQYRMTRDECREFVDKLGNLPSSSDVKKVIMCREHGEM
jgi:hypothetical protein